MAGRLHFLHLPPLKPADHHRRHSVALGLKRIDHVSMAVWKLDEQIEFFTKVGHGLAMAVGAAFVGALQLGLELVVRQRHQW